MCIITVAACWMAVLSAAAREDKKLEMPEIWEQFVLAGAVAKRCNPPDQAKIDQWAVNFTIVTKRATEWLEGASPNARNNPEIATRVMADRFVAIERKVASAIARQGCDAPVIQQELRRFDLQASDFMGLAKAK